jgi:uncharacterized delta-60 repeat protein
VEVGQSSGSDKGFYAQSPKEATVKNPKLALVWMLVLSLLCTLPVAADLTPGHVDTGFDPGLGADNEVLAVAVQADGKVLVGGDFTTFNTVTYNRIARLNADGTLDAGFDPGSGADSLVRAVAVQTDGKVLIGGSFTTFDGVVRARIARLNADGSLDTSFDPGSGADGAVRSVVVQADGKVLIGGEFATVDDTERNGIARLNADGSVDTSFDPGSGASALVYDVAVQSDGKVLVGGGFTTFDGLPRNCIARLNADGSLDTGFDPGTGANNWVDTVALQVDGKVLIGGLFAKFDGTGRNRIARLNADGSLDTGFDPGTGASAVVNAVAVQDDGKVLVGGAFSTLDGVARARIARLNAGGSLDAGFDPGAGANDTLWSVVLQADGKVLVGGDFTTVDGTGRNGIARLNGDGSLDIGLDPGTGASNQVQAVVHQVDGKVLIGGYFTTVDGTSRNGIARLNANGSLDTSFDPGTGADSAVVRAVAVQPDGKVLIAGNFTKVDGVTRNRIARLSAVGAVDTGFDPDDGANDEVIAMAVHDGKVLIGGYFTAIDGTGRNRIARLNGNGTLDTSFNPGTGANDRVLALAVQDDGKVIVAGSFTKVNNVTRNRVARLNGNGTLDSTFDPGTGPNLLVRAVAIQDDGKVLIGGSFNTVSGVSRHYIARLNEDGTLDTTFDPGTGASSWVDAVAVQHDGKVLIGGNFTSVAGVFCYRIARLNVDGSVDTAFDTGTGADGNVFDVAIQPDGKVLIGGDFTKRVARLNGATPPAITSGAPPSTGALGEDYSHTFTASGYPFAPRFYVTGGSLPSGLTLDATTGVLSGKPTTAGNYGYTVSACNYVAPCATEAGTLVIAKGDTTTTITDHTPHPSLRGQAVTVEYNVSSVAGTPTGDVTVSDGTDSCTGSVADGACSLTFTTAGTKTVTAAYAGDENQNPSTSAAIVHTVNDQEAQTSVYLPMVMR